jgi:hypothetical protein
MERAAPADYASPLSRFVRLEVASRTALRQVGESPLPEGLPAGIAAVVWGDFEATGSPCAVAAQSAVETRVTLFAFECGHAPAPGGVPLGGVGASGELRVGLEVSDMDGDGVPDLYVSAHGPKGEVARLRGGASGLVLVPGRLTCPAAFEATSCGDVLPLGDVDGDGYGDAFLAWADRATNDEHLTFVAGARERPVVKEPLEWSVPRDGQ